jgi:hypothetical protein
LAEERNFHFLTNAEFELLTLHDKLAYLSAAIEARHGAGHGWDSLFAEREPGTTPAHPASKPDEPG